MTFWVIGTDLYIKKYTFIDSVQQKRVKKFLVQLEEKGDLVGQPLGYLFFREKKFNGNRLYYLVYKEWNAILLVTISDKKEQSNTIANIKMDFNLYYEFMRKKVNEKQFTLKGVE